MKCPQCGTMMELRQGEYVCPNDGTRLNPKTTMKNRMLGALSALIGFAGAAFFLFIVAPSYELTFFRVITIPFGMYVIAGLFALFALYGAGAVLGMTDVIDLYSRKKK